MEPIENQPIVPYTDLGVIIPAYNAGEIIDEVIFQLKKYVPSNSILVVDDGSRDYTLERCRNLNVLTFSHQNNRGKGAALESGFLYLSNMKLNYFVTLDADGQHDPDHLPRLMEEIKMGYDMVIGNRMACPGDMPFSRRLSNRLSSLVISLVTRQKIPDSQCGFRVMRTEVVRKLKLTATRYDYETEMLLKIARSGHKVGSAPVESRYFAERSQFRHLRDTLLFIRLIFRSLFWRRKSMVHD